MHVAMVSEHASPLAALGEEDAGGQNIHVAALARALAECGVSVTVYTRRDARELPDRVALVPGVVVEHVTAGPATPIARDRLLPYMDDFAAQLRAAWQRRPPHVVHAHFWMSGRAALAAAHPLGIPVIETFHALGVVKRRHQGDNDTSPPERLAEECAVARGVDGVVATSREEVGELRRLGVHPTRIRVVPCGVDLALFRPDGPAEARGERPRIALVSRLVERKGIADVVTALVELPGTELVVAGGPPGCQVHAHPEGARLAGLARALGVADRVELRGGISRSAVPPLLRSADVLVAVPWYEPFGIAPVEAMACGVPVVASAVGGMLDTIVDGVTGVLVPPRRPHRLAAMLRALLSDPELCTAMGVAGAARAHARYGWERVATETLTAYLAFGVHGARGPVRRLVLAVARRTRPAHPALRAASVRTSGAPGRRLGGATRHGGS